MPHRQQLLQLLSDYAYAHEHDIVQRYIAFVSEHEDCFMRLLEKGHVTGSCFLVHVPTSEVLLTHHRKIGAWLQLGGHADGDCDLLRVALKEAEEESGIGGITPLSTSLFDVDIHRIDEHKGVPAHFHYDVRFLLAAPNKNFVISDESINLAWVKITDVARDATMSESLRRMAQKWLDDATYTSSRPRERI